MTSTVAEMCGLCSDNTAGVALGLDLAANRGTEGVGQRLAGQGEVGLSASPRGYPGDELACCSCPEEWLEELEAMDPAERRAVLEELSARPDLWGEQEGVPDGQEEVFDVAIAS